MQQQVLKTQCFQRRALSAKGVSARSSRRAVVPVRAFLAKQEASTSGAMAFKNQLEALKSMSIVVADTGETKLVKKFQPVDCTTNPSLVYKAVQNPEYAHYLKQALEQDKAMTYERDPNRPYSGVADILCVLMGRELLDIVPGRVSTEVDAHLSYDTEATYAKAHKIIDMYSKLGIDKSRVYIKIASTWEGIQACKRLQEEGIDCNLTLLFSFAQAAACADAGAALISPFVGRIMDWYKAKEGRDFAAVEDPGVLSVKRIYEYYKTYDFHTIVMAASFRNIGEIQELAGCDNITISPNLLEELEKNTTPLERKLFPDRKSSKDPLLKNMDSDLFYRLHNTDQMAVEKLKQGIDAFAADQRKLEAQLAELAKEL